MLGNYKDRVDGDYNVWKVTKEDIENYNECPASRYR